jgi:heat shock protein HslJ
MEINTNEIRRLHLTKKKNKYLQMKKYFLTIGVVLAVVGCKTATKTTTTKEAVSKVQPTLVNTQWTLAEVVKGKTPTLVVESGKLSGNAGCNNYFGTLEMDNTQGIFKAKNIGSTRMACPSMSAEASFLKILNEVNRYVVKDHHLELYKDNLLLMKLVKLQK